MTTWRQYLRLTDVWLFYALGVATGVGMSVLCGLLYRW